MWLLISLILLSIQMDRLNMSSCNRTLKSLQKPKHLTLQIITKLHYNWVLGIIDLDFEVE